MIWYEDILSFFDVDSLFEIIPYNEMDLSERLNAVLRASLYLSIVAFAITNDYRSFILFIVVAGITYAVYQYRDKDLDTENIESYNENDNTNKKEHFNSEMLERASKKCTVPTRENPFMNITMNEYVENPKRKKACAMNDKIGEYVNKYFDENLYRTTDDIYHKNASERQFYTMPTTEIPNDQDKFAQWLYGNPEKTCKEGNGLKCKYFS